MSQDKPVAAQEPIFWACYAKEKLVEVTNNTEYVHTFKCNFPLTHRIVPLYDHAVPCASIGVKVLREQQAKITEQTEELRIIRANLAQLEKDFDRRNEVVDAQVERIKDLEANKCKPFDENLQMKCVKALLGRTDGELESLSEKMLNSYIEDVTRVYNTITKE